MRNSERVKLEFGNEDVDFAVLRPKAPNRSPQPTTKQKEPTPQRLGPRAISEKSEHGALDLGFLVGV
jgi:hypothetical protein